MNVLITADMHIGEYNDYNYSPNARIEQFYKLAQRYIEIATENKCEELWIAGDFLKVPNNKPEVEHIVKDFLIPLNKHFKKVRYILGQHDRNNKSDLVNKNNTFITILDLDKFEYCDKKVFKFGNTEIAFMNWYPSQNLEWLDHKVDIFIGHYTKSYLFGQEIDESKFDLCIHGDIHNDQVIGKFVSICTPFQHDMNCVPEGSCIVLNCETKEWKRIKTDPDHTRFLQIKYVTDQLLEGFDGPLTYNIYRPVLVKNQDGIPIDVPKWNDISELIESYVESKNFRVIHDEIKTKCVEYSEVDFNFQLKSVKVHGFRSVVDFELNFDGNDRIILLGKNGSGKSSVILALKAMFERCRYMKDERSEFTDSVSVTISLFYQNKLFEITKGDKYGLKIDGIAQPYGNQTQFEDDLFKKFLFFDSSDLFFVTSDIQNLSSKFKDDRRIELISKFYRLDRIDAYSRTAFQLNQELTEKSVPVKNDLTKAKGALETIELRLKELKIISEVDIDELKKISNFYVKLREDYNHYQIWKTKHEKLIGRKEELERTLKVYELKLNPEHGIEYITNRIEELNSQLAQLEEFESNFNKRWIRLSEITLIKNQLYNEGLELKNQVDSLKQRKCSLCGSSLNEGIASQKIKEIESKIEDVKKKYLPIYEEYSSYSEQERTSNYFESESRKLKEGLRNKKDELGLFTTKKTQYDIAKERFDSEVKNLETLKLEISNFELEKPEEVKLPMNLSDLEYSVTSQINSYETYLNERKKESEKIKEIENLETKIRELQLKSDFYLEYMQLMSRTGGVYYEILKKLADVFSESNFKYDVKIGEYRGKSIIVFNSFYKVKDKLRIYEKLSDGQKTVCDLDFLNKLFSVRVGILVLDEHLKHLDEDNLQKASDILSRMNANSIIISTHDTNYSQYTKKILLELTPEGQTNYKIF
jgi:energy-coupling factor transporter ATP-binding protein EcfA2